MSLKDPPAEINLTKAFLVECLDCGHQTLFSPTQNDCPNEFQTHSGGAVGKTAKSLVQVIPLELKNYLVKGNQISMSRLAFGIGQELI